ncbi:Rubrerythrin [Caloramator mitchellensis]|uniref:Rubrerythrin n=1 Tax=Caloramator mitchellensis TaxID=908809 RepID=A0A0R3K4F2_CALMK|nr:rubrerythrin family protein [Caloramator mitchellensis]KRQ87989.1 Rubrerythrin [Caloramator mitchellensis]
MNLKGSKTEQNLLKTYAGESRARNMYTFFAEKSREDGYEFIASVFIETSDNEKAHARRVFNDFLKMNKSTAENLLEAARGEAHENEKLYKEFESVAHQEGFHEIADFYKELAETEGYHRDRFDAILQNLKSGKIFRRDMPVKWHCRNCGYIHEGYEAPEKCPLCGFPRSYFEIYCENFK